MLRAGVYPDWLLEVTFWHPWQWFDWVQDVIEWEMWNGRRYPKVVHARIVGWRRWPLSFWTGRNVA